MAKTRLESLQKKEKQYRQLMIQLTNNNEKKFVFSSLSQKNRSSRFARVSITFRIQDCRVSFSPRKNIDFYSVIGLNDYPNQGTQLHEFQSKHPKTSRC